MRFLISSILLGCLFAPLAAQTRKPPAESTPKKVTKTTPREGVRTTAPPEAKPDPHIVAALRDVSSARIQATIQKLVGFGNRNTIGPADEASIKRGFGVGAAREWIKSEFERFSKDCGGCLEVKTEGYEQAPADRIPNATEIVDVYAVLKGTDPEQAKRIFLVTGHYDSRNSDTLNVTDPAPGANDDGSGTAVSLECARVLSKHKFPATIIFLTVAGEEQGLNGSRHFAKMAKEAGWKIEGVLNNDIVGGNKSAEQEPSIVRVFSEGIPETATEADVKRIRGLGNENDSPSRELARYVVETARKYLPSKAGSFGPKMVFRRDRYLRGGDHTAFNEQGFTAIRFTEYREDFNRQHQTLRTENGIEYGDLPKYVDFDYVANVARLNAATLASLASAPPPPQNVKLLTKKLENDSSLAWETPPGTDGVRYEVVWRPTTAAEWENTEPGIDGNQTSIKRSKDNVIFAVRSVDKQGHASLPVVPTPER
jgi:hypothetical protein